MKIGGKEVTQPVTEILVLPRGEDSIIIKARGLSDFDMFETLCPLAKPPGKLVKGQWIPDPDEPSYKEILAVRAAKKLAFMVIHSLEPSDIEWARVKPDNASTWLEWDKELKEAGFTQVEINRITQLVLEANCLSEDKLREAREVFLHGHQQA